jgi:beta-N-acetylhexosaminidase
VQLGRSRQRAPAVVSAVAVTCAFIAGCAGGGASASPAGPAGTARPTGAAASASTGTASAPSAAPGAGSPTTGSPAAACATQVLGNLTLAQRVGELFLVGVDDNIAGPELTAAERTYHFGSLLLNKTAAGTAALEAQTAAMQELAPAGTSGARLFIAANQEGGQIQQLSGPGFAAMPSALEQGSWSLSTLRAAATDWGTDLRAAGVNLDLAPVMDVVPPGSAASNAPIGALDREFGFGPVTNGGHGTAFIQGMAAAGVMTVAKHFPGLGRVAGNTDFTSNVVDNVTTATDPDLNSFRTAIGAGVPMVMVALATYTKIDPAQLAVFSPTVMRLLRNGLGFNGVIVSDDMGQAAAVQAVPAGTRAIDFLTAGGDLVTSQSLAPAEQMAAAVLAKASGNSAFRATVDSAAQRVLAAKRAAGLLPC